MADNIFGMKFTMTDEDNRLLQPLTKHHALKTKNRQKVFRLPIGITLQVAYLSIRIEYGLNFEG